MRKNRNTVIDENTPLMVLAGPMFLELLLNTMLHNVDTVMLSHYDEYAVGVVFGLGVAGIFIGTATDECIRGMIVMYYWYRKKWLGKSVIDSKTTDEVI